MSFGALSVGRGKVIWPLAVGVLYAPPGAVQGHHAFSLSKFAAAYLQRGSQRDDCRRGWLDFVRLSPVPWRAAVSMYGTVVFSSSAMKAMSLVCGVYGMVLASLLPARPPSPLA